MKSTFILALLLATPAQAGWFKVPVSITNDGKFDHRAPDLSEIQGKLGKGIGRWSGSLVFSGKTPVYYLVFVDEDTSAVGSTPTSTKLTKSDVQKELTGKGVNVDMIEAQPAKGIRGAFINWGWKAWEWIQPALAWAASGSDDFNRANADPIGGNWTQNDIGWGNSIKLVSNHVEDNGTGDPSKEAGAFWNVFSAASDQFSQVVFAATPTLSTDCGGPTVRAESATHTYYSAQGCGAGGLTTLLTYYDGAGYNDFASSTGETWLLTNAIKIVVIGSGFTVYQNGVSVLTGSDASSSAGRPGVFAFNSTLQFDSWCGGDGTACPSTTAVRHRPMILQ